MQSRKHPGTVIDVIHLRCAHRLMSTINNFKPLFAVRGSESRAQSPIRNMSVKADFVAEYRLSDDYKEKNRNANIIHELEEMKRVAKFSVSAHKRQDVRTTNPQLMH